MKKLVGRVKITNSLIRSFFFHEKYKNIGSYVIFLGAPRSGHTMIAEFINSHKNAHISTKPTGRRWFSKEHAYQLAIDHFKDSRHGRYYVNSGYQGTVVDPRCVGIRNAPGTTQRIADDIDSFFRKVNSIGLPIKTIHVYRDPIENIAKIRKYNQMSITDAALWYMSLIKKTMAINEKVPCAQKFEISHESFLVDPENVFLRLVKWLELEKSNVVVEEFCGMLWESPSKDESYYDVVEYIPREVSFFLLKNHPFYLI